MPKFRECYGLVCGDPKGAGRLIFMLVGTLLILLIGIIKYGVVAALEKITGKDYLYAQSKQSLSNKED